MRSDICKHAFEKKATMCICEIQRINMRAYISVYTCFSLDTDPSAIPKAAFRVTGQNATVV